MREENHSMVFTPTVIKDLLSDLQDGEMLTITIASAESDVGMLRREEHGRDK